MYRPSTRNEWMFCGTLFAQGSIVTLLEIFILVEWYSWINPPIYQVPVSYVVPISLAILIFACVYETLLSLDAVHHKNSILLTAICFSNLCIIIFASLKCVETKDAVTSVRYGVDGTGHPFTDSSKDLWNIIQPAVLAAPIILALSSAGLILAAYRLQRDYTWIIYKTIHGDPSLRWRYLAYELYIVLIKYVFFFLVAFIVEYNLIDVHFSESEYNLTLALVPTTFVVMILGIYCVKQEMKWAMAFIVMCFLGLIAYLLSRIVVLCGSSRRAHTIAKDTMLLFASVSLALTVLTLATAIQCVINFDHGVSGVNPRHATSRSTTMGSRTAFYPLETAYAGRTSDDEEIRALPPYRFVVN
ncbi:uncharacterized protein BO97DRAFT_359230 [Aspergillus homomorphus CBS 101889]|uniref:Uncharacterized protein n=1 Tax=Aspergillus homomorphus (strain CBS 101889) TaxID=1450537 RepID=A0A395IBJ5_ASPHC|nr:hypothetical protein BO97DRAFT_359230 [Aspergillus homomorphus CBS 101889]RAL17426.1 hypothetical protein BO97DRAFT_359230 [Aspergillus homomorphus CBS 101889]